MGGEGVSVKRLVLLRHGESTWNQENRFTGWTDVGLTQKGVEEAVQSGRALLTEGFTFDVVYTSVLQRAIKTTWLVLEEMDLMWIPVYRSWENGIRNSAIHPPGSRVVATSHTASHLLSGLLSSNR